MNAGVWNPLLMSSEFLHCCGRQLRCHIPFSFLVLTSTNASGIMLSIGEENKTKSGDIVFKYLALLCAILVVSRVSASEFEQVLFIPWNDPTYQLSYVEYPSGRYGITDYSVQDGILYLLDFPGERILQIDLNSGKLINTYKTGIKPFAFAFENPTLYATANASYDLTVFDNGTRVQIPAGRVGEHDMIEDLLFLDGNLLARGVSGMIKIRYDGHESKPISNIVTKGLFCGNEIESSNIRGNDNHSAIIESGEKRVIYRHASNRKLIGLQLIAVLRDCFLVRVDERQPELFIQSQLCTISKEGKLLNQTCIPSVRYANFPQGQVFFTDRFHLYCLMLSKEGVRVFAIPLSSVDAMSFPEALSRRCPENIPLEKIKKAKQILEKALEAGRKRDGLPQ